MGNQPWTASGVGTTKECGGLSLLKMRSAFLPKRKRTDYWHSKPYPVDSTVFSRSGQCSELLCYTHTHTHKDERAKNRLGQIKANLNRQLPSDLTLCPLSKCERFVASLPVLVWDEIFIRVSMGSIVLSVPATLLQSLSYHPPPLNKTWYVCQVILDSFVTSILLYVRYLIQYVAKCLLDFLCFIFSFPHCFLGLLGW
jgi:hypothetical protein